MLKEKKAQVIEHLEDVLSRSKISILADYRGLNTAQLTALRRKLGEAGADCEVVKNTLARIALERAGRSAAGKLFEGPVVLISGYDEETLPAKIIQAYINETRLTIAMKGGILNEKLLSADDVVALAKLPAREVLIASVVGGMQAPIYGLVNCLAGPMRGLLTVLRGRIQQIEGN
jgi:large subunit ribosomal protein L10